MEGARGGNEELRHCCTLCPVADGLTAVLSWNAYVKSGNRDLVAGLPCHPLCIPAIPNLRSCSNEQLWTKICTLPQLERRVPCEKRGRLEPSDNRWNRKLAGRPQPPTKTNDGGALKNRFARIPTLQRAHHKFRWERKHKKPNIPSSLGGSHTAQHDSTINLSFLNSSRLSHPPSAHSSFCFVSL